MKPVVKNNILSWTGLLLASCLFVATVILANTALINWRIDLTENKLFTLSTGTINILKRLEEPIQFDFYLSRKAIVDFPSLANYGIRVSDLLKEYAAHANGKIILNIIEPETFSEAEDQAVASGLQTISVNAVGDRVYFGLVGTNSTDDERVLPFFQTNRAAALEYDITKLVYNLAYPDKPVVGVLSQLPVMGKSGDSSMPTWTIINALGEFFDVRDLTDELVFLDQSIDVLLLIHPKQLADKTLYAIDQYLLGGGKAMIFLDPLAEQDKSQPAPENPNALPKLDSYLPTLLEAWGMALHKEKIVGDRNAAMRVQVNNPRGPREIEYLPWLRLTKDNFSADDFSTSELNVVHLGTAGALVTNNSQMKVTPLLQSSVKSTLLERDLILFQRDPSVVLNNFESLQRRLLLAARIEGLAKTIFPDGLTTATDETESRVDKDFLQEGQITAIVVSDTDILADHFWVRSRQMFGVEVPEPIANNGDFVINSIENLAGSTDLISLRGRENYARPFTKVAALQREAEARFRQREKELQASLAEIEQQLRSLQQEQGGETAYLLDNQITTEIENYNNKRLAIRKELRGVQHDLQKDIEQLGNVLRFINIGLIPLLIMLLALAIGIYRTRAKASV